MPNPIRHTSQAIDNWSFDETYQEATFLPVEEDPSGVLLRKTTDNLALMWATDSGDSTIIYVGESTPGSVANSAVWRIQKVDTTNGTIEWADGDTNFNNNFSNREGLSYS